MQGPCLLGASGWSLEDYAWWVLMDGLCMDYVSWVFVDGPWWAVPAGYLWMVLGGLCLLGTSEWSLQELFPAGCLKMVSTVRICCFHFVAIMKILN